MSRAVISWNRFTTPGFTIAAELVGASHTFSYESRLTRVLLPPATEASEDTASNREPRYRVVSRRTADLTPLSFAVSDVEFRIDQPRSSELDHALALYASGDKFAEATSKVVIDAGKIAVRAFEHWLGVVRWRTANGTIGRLAREQRQMWGDNLRDADTLKQVVPGVSSLIATGSAAITQAQWADIQATLTRGHESPLFYQLYFDGSYSLAEGDTRRAVIDLTSACEVVLKILLDRSLPDGMLTVARQRLMKSPASVLIQRFARPLLGDDLWERLKPHDRFDRLLFERNQVVHSHQHYTPSASDCYHFQKAVRDLLAFSMQKFDDEYG